MRPSLRKTDELRAVQIELDYLKSALGSCMIHFGDTRVICTATYDEKVPPFLKNTRTGWVTAEYGMLPCSTETRVDREAAKGKQSGRTQEIQRLIGRSLRAVVDMKLLGECQIKIDCDVIQADGGTRTASITGAYVALHMAVDKLLKQGILKRNPIIDTIAAISCGIYHDQAVLDLDYAEDSQAKADANFVMTGKGGIVEIQATAEELAFSDEQFEQMFSLARHGIKKLTKFQKEVLGIDTISKAVG